ncbi:lysophospholipid acyltransferase family protein [Asticcacaulis sp. YBE204]|uniref:lysophospholipid acyltransferase family protein n=1 Tax=Asticcacaulis sp. YBE204 TaxID=1282363 RepID=UPI0003C3ED5E|nr:lysophospholipid acyltransferase family protein [Asticcacaulis sp. YBE204]ESQ77985.1 hypothetical protein AEYBE204_15935 [Asticcacaulis sp. YBE204]
MKAALNTPFVQNLMAAIVVAYLRFCYATTRWTQINREPVEALWDAHPQRPIVWMFWHQRLHLGHAAWPKGRAQALAVLASLSKSGAVSVRINTRFGHTSIRGSSAKKSDPNKDKRGTQAFRELLRWLRDGNAVAMTPDGPRGPAQVMTEGSLKLSQMTDAPMVLLGQSTRRFVTLNSWDHMRIPLPFTRGVMVWEVLPPVPRDADEDRLTVIRLEAEATLTALTDRADAIAGVS